MTYDFKMNDPKLTLLMYVIELVEKKTGEQFVTTEELEKFDLISKFPVS
jgi:hypothetical protein